MSLHRIIFSVILFLSYQTSWCSNPDIFFFSYTLTNISSSFRLFYVIIPSSFRVYPFYYQITFPFVLLWLLLLHLFVCFILVIIQSFFHLFYRNHCPFISLFVFLQLLSPRIFVCFIHTIIHASFRSFYFEYTLPLFCSDVTDIGVACFYLVLEKLPKIILFLPAS